MLYVLKLKTVKKFSYPVGESIVNDFAVVFKVYDYDTADFLGMIEVDGVRWGHEKRESLPSGVATKSFRDWFNRQGYVTNNLKSFDFQTLNDIFCEFDEKDSKGTRKNAENVAQS